MRFLFYIGLNSVILASIQVVCQGLRLFAVRNNSKGGFTQRYYSPFMVSIRIPDTEMEPPRPIEENRPEVDLFALRLLYFPRRTEKRGL